MNKSQNAYTTRYCVFSSTITIFTGRSLIHLSEQFYRVGSYRDVAVGIFRFQRRLHYCAILPQDLPLDADNTFVQVYIASFESHQLTAPQAGGEVDVVQLKYAAVPCFLEKCVRAVQKMKPPRPVSVTQAGVILHSTRMPKYETYYKLIIATGMHRGSAAD